MSRIANFKRDDGFSLVELLVAMSVGMIVLMGVLAIVQGSARSSARTTARVNADQTARPALSRIIDELHSTCIAPDIAPILPGSTGRSMTFLHSTERGVSPAPTKRTITWTEGAAGTGPLTETAVASTGGTAPSWTWAPTGTTTQLLTGVGKASIEGAEVEPFRYYTYDAPTQSVVGPVTVPAGGLTSQVAAQIVKVTVAFSVTPPKTTVNADPGAKVSLQDSALLRFAPATSTVAQNLLPC